MDRAQQENVGHPQPIPRRHQRVHRLHDVNRRHGEDRYHPYARELENVQDQRARAHTQYYQYHWATVNNRWIWIRPDPYDRTNARCIACGINLRAYVTNIGRHERSNNHIRSMQRINVPIDNVYDHHLTMEEFTDEVARQKLLISMFFADEGIAFIKVDRFLHLIKRLALHADALMEVFLSDTEVSKICKKVVAPIHKQELATTLSRTSKFSILFDESTGISKDKNGCLLVRFADNRSYKIRTVLWDLIPIFREDDVHNAATAETLYELIENSLFGEALAHAENRVVLPRQNLIASSTDGCNTMVGVHNSVVQRLRDNFPGFVHITCSCHKCHLCAMAAIAEFPEITQILTDIYNWFCSAKRLHALQQSQIRLNMNVRRILRCVSTRWLTALPALIRLDEQLVAIDATLADHPENQQAMQLLILLRTPLIRCIIKFLMFILEIPEDLNGWLQTDLIAILPLVFSRISFDFKDILLCFMNPEYVENTNALEIDIENEQFHLADDDMQIGMDARQLAQELPPDEYAIFMRRVRQYLIHLSTEWLERLVIPWAPYQCVESLLEHNARSLQYHVENPNVIHELVVLFPRALPAGADEDMMQMEWDRLILDDNQDLLEQPADVETAYFWFLVKNFTIEQEFRPYEQLANFMLNILSTPPSNAQSERTWSWEKYFKNKYRNKLAVQTVKSSIQIKECLKMSDCEKRVHLFQPTREMIRRVRERDFGVNLINQLPEPDPDSDLDIFADEDAESEDENSDN